MRPAAGLGTVEELCCCEIRGFWKVRAFHWVFPNVLRNAAVNGGSLSLSPRLQTGIGGHGIVGQGGCWVSVAGKSQAPVSPRGVLLPRAGR